MGKAQKYKVPRQTNANSVDGDQKGQYGDDKLKSQFLYCRTLSLIQVEDSSYLALSDKQDVTDLLPQHIFLQKHQIPQFSEYFKMY